MNAFLPDPLVVDYCAAKGGTGNLCKALSKEFGPQGVRVNTVSPGRSRPTSGLARTASRTRSAKAQGRKPSDIEAGAAARAVTGRFTRPHEVADLVLLLASDRTSNVTGADFVIDGGTVTTL